MNGLLASAGAAHVTSPVTGPLLILAILGLFFFGGLPFWRKRKK